MFFLVACGANDDILKSGKETPAAPASNSPTVGNPIKEDIDAMHTAGFAFIYVLRRKDGGVMESEDLMVIKRNTVGVNRRISSDEGKAFIIGSNPPIPPENLKAITDHFAVDDQSAMAADKKVNSQK
jgi:hypothetical protein